MLPDIVFKRMHELAEEAFSCSYAPYSKLSIGASLWLEGDVFVGGCNVENASYGLTICAERSAVFNAVQKVAKKPVIKGVLVLSDAKEPIPPCGACRQVIAEFGLADTIVRWMNKQGDSCQLLLKELLPHCFSLETFKSF